VTAENSKSKEPPHPRETTENSTKTADSFTKTGRVHQKRLRIPQKQPTCCYPGTANQTPPEKGHSRTTRDIIKQNTKGTRRKSSEITPGPSDTVNNQKIEKLEEP
jgi:hypothetical protein